MISVTIVTLLLLFSSDIKAQGHKIGGGLSFATGVDFNQGGTGNPGVTLKTWWAINKRGTFHIVPSLTAFNRYRLETGYIILTNYMFQGDLNAQYALLQEGTVKIIAFGGGNFTYLASYFKPIVVTGNETITDQQDQALGANLGAGLELRMSPKWDFDLTGKYIFSKYPQFVISVQAVYYFKSRMKAYRR